MEDRLTRHLLTAAFWAVSALLAPLLPGIVNRVKAFFAGRTGIPLLQGYRDIYKLLRKGAVYSRTTTWVFRLGPVLGLSAMLTALMMVPFAGHCALLAFEGDILVFAGLLALARFLTVVSALDTGSGFEGMGASREVQFALFVEPAFFLAMAALMRQAGSLSLSGVYGALSLETWQAAGPVIALSAASLFLVFLAENARVPVDDPDTHLELTMIHEVMVLDHSGPDFAYISFSSCVKFWALGALVAGLFLPKAGALPAWAHIIVFILILVLFAILVGTIESVLARLRLLKVPRMLMAASAFAILALILGAEF
ncbi:MAG: NADH-quinone oxidoreductase subunit H [Fibrobacterota bacterium]